MKIYTQRLEDISSVLDLPIQTVEGVTQSGVLDSSQSANGAAIFTAHPQLREALFTKEADPNLFKKDFNLSFRGGGRLLADKFILKKKPKNYMDLK